ncbi:GNAT family N-acetyltransferase [Microbacterium suaedae]|uniref:GNAT family N-acetyltransferase n=1 Tax=Microbacterium suaedae TaxID=2067813 RepID=UPI000DA19EAC|nr:GNAT family N-acetyltransferase [Microbacterium suaedae]
MSHIDARTVPVDETSRARLAEGGLDYRIVSGDALDDFLRSSARGFLGEEPTDAEIAAERELFEQTRRAIAVYDPTAAQPYPVATEASWVMSLAIPGGRMPMWAISDVTVSATHRRRGIARAMLEGELRAARDAGLAIAGLTVSEATIYGRYGFAPAAPASEITVDTRRAGWGATDPAVRVLFVEREQVAADLEELHERTFAERPGDVRAWTNRWRQRAGLVEGVDKPRQIRGVRAIDESGALVGAMAFRVNDGESFSSHVLEISHLVAATPDAHAALWRFAITYDLVSTVRADLQATDDPLPWLVADPRGVTLRPHDHGWLRILDVPAALRARSLSGAFGVRLRVTDPIGLADGAWTVAQMGADGVRVEPLADGERAEVTLDIGALSAAYLGSVRLETLQAAGRVAGDPEKIAALSDALRVRTAPRLSIWY